MFGIWNRKRLKAGSQWSVLVSDFDTSTNAFYDLIRKAIEEKRVPDVEISEIEFREGGLLSARRRYLRLRREYHVFDICSAPYGTSWFFSCRFGEYPMSLRYWEVAVILAVAFALLSVHAAVFGWLWGSFVFALNAASFLFSLNSLVATGLYRLDAVIMRIPVLGAFYEVFLRGDTYHRGDTRTMYFCTVDRIIRNAVEATCAVRPEGAGEFREESPVVGRAWWTKVREALSSIG